MTEPMTKTKADRDDVSPGRVKRPANVRLGVRDTLAHMSDPNRSALKAEAGQTP